MIKIADRNGNPIKGLVRGANGQIIVDDDDAYLKYVRTRKLEQKVEEQERKIDEIHDMLRVIIEKLQKD